jgi:hypothetical protein
MRRKERREKKREAKEILARKPKRAKEREKNQTLFQLLGIEPAISPTPATPHQPLPLPLPHLQPPTSHIQSPISYIPHPTSQNIHTSKLTHTHPLNTSLAHFIHTDVL